MNSDTIETCRVALHKWHDIVIQHSRIYIMDERDEVLARIDAALLDLEQPSEWTPLQTKIAFGFGHESIVCDATSIGGLPLPDDVMIMQRTPAQPRSTFNLIPCAHCGGEAKIIRASEENEGLVFLIKCCRCPATMDFDSVLPELEAIAAWNQRAPQPAAGVPLPEDVAGTISDALNEDKTRLLAEREWWSVLSAGYRKKSREIADIDTALAWLQRQRGAGE